MLYKPFCCGMHGNPPCINNFGMCWSHSNNQILLVPEISNMRSLGWIKSPIKGWLEYMLHLKVQLVKTKPNLNNAWITMMRDTWNKTICRPSHVSSSIRGDRNVFSFHVGLNTASNIFFRTTKIFSPECCVHEGIVIRWKLKDSHLNEILFKHPNRTSLDK